MNNTYKNIAADIFEAVAEAERDSNISPNWTYRVWLMPNGKVETEEIYGGRYSQHEWTKDALCEIAEFEQTTPVEDWWDADHDLLDDFTEYFEEEFAEKKLYEEYESVQDYILDKHYSEYVDYVIDDFMDNFQPEFDCDYDWDTDWVEVNGERYTFNDCNTLVPYEEEDE